jgi:hypothetical protein
VRGTSVVSSAKDAVMLRISVLVSLVKAASAVAAIEAENLYDFINLKLALKFPKFGTDVLSDEELEKIKKSSVGFLPLPTLMNSFSFCYVSLN